MGKIPSAGPHHATAKPLVKPVTLPASDVAWTVPRNKKNLVLLATHSMARDQNLGANEGFLDQCDKRLLVDLQRFLA